MSSNGHNRNDDEPSVPSWLREAAKAEPQEPPWVPQPGDVIDDKFKIIEKVGEGGVGIVYRAFHQKLERDVAIKLMNVAGKEDLFEREAKATRRIPNSNTITILDAGRTHGTTYLVFEWLEGMTLREALRKRTFYLKEVIRIMICVTDALNRAHSLRIIHRDLSSNNVFLTNDGRVKVLDFGLAAYDWKRRSLLSAAQNASWENVPESLGREVVSDLSSSAAMALAFELIQDRNSDPRKFESNGDAHLASKAHNRINEIICDLFELGTNIPSGGTLGFVAPEQFRNELATVKSDVWSAGVLLFLLITRQMPFAAKSIREYIEQVQSQRAPKLREYAPHSPASLESLVGRMLNRNPKLRPTANDVFYQLLALSDNPDHKKLRRLMRYFEERRRLRKRQ